MFLTTLVLLTQLGPIVKPRSQCDPFANPPVACSVSVEGRCYTDTDDDFLYYCNGTSWVTTTSPTPTPAPSPTAPPSPTAITSTSSNFNFDTTTPYFAETDKGNSGTAVTINWSTGGSKQKVTITGNCTFTFTAPPGPATLVLRLVHENSASSYTLTWPTCVLGTSGVCWPGATVLSNTNTANAQDIVTFYYNGQNYLAIPAANFS